MGSQKDNQVNGFMTRIDSQFELLMINHTRRTLRVPSKLASKGNVKGSAVRRFNDTHCPLSSVEIASLNVVSIIFLYLQAKGWDLCRQPSRLELCLVEYFDGGHTS